MAMTTKVKESRDYNEKIEEKTVKEANSGTAASPPPPLPPPPPSSTSIPIPIPQRGTSNVVLRVPARHAQPPPPIPIPIPSSTSTSTMNTHNNNNNNNNNTRPAVVGSGTTKTTTTSDAPHVSQSMEHQTTTSSSTAAAPLPLQLPQPPRVGIQKPSAKSSSSLPPPPPSSSSSHQQKPNKNNSNNNSNNNNNNNDNKNINTGKKNKEEEDTSKTGKGKDHPNKNKKANQTWTSKLKHLFHGSSECQGKEKPKTATTTTPQSQDAGKTNGATEKKIITKGDSVDEKVVEKEKEEAKVKPTPTSTIKVAETTTTTKDTSAATKPSSSSVPITLDEKDTGKDDPKVSLNKEEDTALKGKEDEEEEGRKRSPSQTGMQHVLTELSFHSFSDTMDVPDPYEETEVEKDHKTDGTLKSKVEDSSVEMKRRRKNESGALISMADDAATGIKNHIDIDLHSEGGEESGNVGKNPPNREDQFNDTNNSLFYTCKDYGEGGGDAEHETTTEVIEMVLDNDDDEDDDIEGDTTSRKNNTRNNRNKNDSELKTGSMPRVSHTKLRSEGIQVRPSKTSSSPTSQPPAERVHSMLSFDEVLGDNSLDTNDRKEEEEEEVMFNEAPEAVVTTIAAAAKPPPPPPPPQQRNANNNSQVSFSFSVDHTTSAGANPEEVERNAVSKHPGSNTMENVKEDFMIKAKTASLEVFKHHHHHQEKEHPSRSSSSVFSSVNFLNSDTTREDFRGNDNTTNNNNNNNEDGDDDEIVFDASSIASSEAKRNENHPPIIQRKGISSTYTSKAAAAAADRIDNKKFIPRLDDNNNDSDDDGEDEIQFTSTPERGNATGKHQDITTPLPVFRGLSRGTAPSPSSSGSANRNTNSTLSGFCVLNDDDDDDDGMDTIGEGGIAAMGTDSIELSFRDVLSSAERSNKQYHSSVPPQKHIMENRMSEGTKGRTHTLQPSLLPSSSSKQLAHTRQRVQQSSLSPRKDVNMNTRKAKLVEEEKKKKNKKMKIHEEENKRQPCMQLPDGPMWWRSLSTFQTFPLANGGRFEGGKEKQKKVSTGVISSNEDGTAARQGNSTQVEGEKNRVGHKNPTSSSIHSHAMIKNNTTYGKNDDTRSRSAPSRLIPCNTGIGTMNASSQKEGRNINQSKRERWNTERFHTSTHSANPQRCSSLSKYPPRRAHSLPCYFIPLCCLPGLPLSPRVEARHNNWAALDRTTLYSYAPIGSGDNERERSPSIPRETERQSKPTSSLKVPVSREVEHMEKPPAIPRFQSRRRQCGDEDHLPTVVYPSARGTSRGDSRNASQGRGGRRTRNPRPRRPVRWDFYEGGGGGTNSTSTGGGMEKPEGQSAAAAERSRRETPHTNAGDPSLSLMSVLMRFPTDEALAALRCSPSHAAPQDGFSTIHHTRRDRPRSRSRSSSTHLGHVKGKRNSDPKRHACYIATQREDPVPPSSLQAVVAAHKRGSGTHGNAIKSKTLNGYAAQLDTQMKRLRVVQKRNLSSSSRYPKQDGKVSLLLPTSSRVLAKYPVVTTVKSRNILSESITSPQRVAPSPPPLHSSLDSSLPRINGDACVEEEEKTFFEPHSEEERIASHPSHSTTDHLEVRGAEKSMRSSDGGGGSLNFMESSSSSSSGSSVAGEVVKSERHDSYSHTVRSNDVPDQHQQGKEKSLDDDDVNDDLSVHLNPGERKVSSERIHFEAANSFATTGSVENDGNGTEGRPVAHALEFSSFVVEGSHEEEEEEDNNMQEYESEIVSTPQIEAENEIEEVEEKQEGSLLAGDVELDAMDAEPESVPSPASHAIPTATVGSSKTSSVAINEGMGCEREEEEEEVEDVHSAASFGLVETPARRLSASLGSMVAATLETPRTSTPLASTMPVPPLQLHLLGLNHPSDAPVVASSSQTPCGEKEEEDSQRKSHSSSVETSEERRSGCRSVGGSHASHHDQMKPSPMKASSTSPECPIPCESKHMPPQQPPATETTSPPPFLPLRGVSYTALRRKLDDLEFIIASHPRLFFPIVNTTSGEVQSRTTSPASAADRVILSPNGRYPPSSVPHASVSSPSPPPPPPPPPFLPSFISSVHTGNTKGRRLSTSAERWVVHSDDSLDDDDYDVYDVYDVQRHRRQFQYEGNSQRASRGRDEAESKRESSSIWKAESPMEEKPFSMTMTPRQQSQQLHHRATPSSYSQSSPGLQKSNETGKMRSMMTPSGILRGEVSGTKDTHEDSNRKPFVHPHVDPLGERRTGTRTENHSSYGKEKMMRKDTGTTHIPVEEQKVREKEAEEEEKARSELLEPQRSSPVESTPEDETSFSSSSAAGKVENVEEDELEEGDAFRDPFFVAEREQRGRIFVDYMDAVASLQEHYLCVAELYDALHDAEAIRQGKYVGSGGKVRP